MNPFKILMVLICTLLYQPTTAQEMDINLIKGKWFLKEYTPDFQVYTREPSSRPSFDFKAKQQVVYQRCQDMCGCLPIVYYGTWSLNKDQVLLHYTKQVDYMIRYPKGKKTQIEKHKSITIVELSKDRLTIQSYTP